ncbi:hypothetical protein V3C99_017005 [Haemonchus contortus]
MRNETSQVRSFFIPTDSINSFYFHLYLYLDVEFFCRRGGYSGGPVKDGSVAPVHLVISEEVKNITGGYFNNRGKRITSLSADSTDAKQQDRLWTMSEEICSKFGITF